jgi:HlyD family secretion protein
MAASKKGRKILVFSVIGLVIAGLAAVAILRKREPVITIQTEKIGRRSITEIVVANGKIQPVLQVKISPEVSGEIIELPVKEGDSVKKGDLILKIKPDFYIARRNEAEASYKSSLAGQLTAEANLARAEAEFKRNEELMQRKLISDSIFMEVKTSRDVAKAQVQNSKHQVEMANAFLARAEEELAKTTIVSPLTGTISKLNSQLGERVVGTATMAGTDVMIIADLNEMEARVDIGEVDIVLIQPGQKARLEVDAFKDRKFTGEVTEIANSSKGSGFGMSSGSSTEATKFEVKIRIKEKEPFRPGMSVTSEVETRYRTNVLAVPIASVTTRVPKPKEEKKDKAKEEPKYSKKKSETTVAARTNAVPELGETVTNSTSAQTGTNVASAGSSTNNVSGDKKKESKPIEVVFILDGDKVKMAPVKIGISDDTHWEILEGVEEGQEVVSGGYRAISRDLEDGKKVRKGLATDKDKDKEKDGENRSET